MDNRRFVFGKCRSEMKLFVNVFFSDQHFTVARVVPFEIKMKGTYLWFMLRERRREVMHEEES